MRLLDYAIRRLDAFSEAIRLLKDADFPYQHSTDALDYIESRIGAQRANLARIDPNADAKVLKAACTASLDALWEYLPILGFIARSTNVRNAFECYGPFLRLCRKVLGNDTKLIISSEWDYSPVVYMYPLPDFVMLGVPAPESSNPLLMPLIGHELGHPFWHNNGYALTYSRRVEDSIIVYIESIWDEYVKVFKIADKTQLRTELFAQNTWAPAYDWAMMQAEEIFCDLVGLRLFGDSYLNAFAYLIAPCLSGERPLTYPNTLRRIQHLVDAAANFGCPIPVSFAEIFDDQPEPFDHEAKLLLSAADAASSAIVPTLIGEVESSITGVPARVAENVDALKKSFANTVPPVERHSVCDIFTAAWDCFLDGDLWKESSQITTRNRDRVLADLVLKSLEVAEFHDLVD